MATTWPFDCSAPTIARFWCGVTRPNTECCSSTSASSSLVLGQLAGVEALGRVGEADLRARPRRPCAGCRRRSPSAPRPARGSTRGCRPRRGGSSPRTSRARRARARPGSASPSSGCVGAARARARAARSAASSSARRARRRRWRRRAPSRARPSPTSRARRTSPRSTCGPTRTAPRRCASTLGRGERRPRARPAVALRFVVGERTERTQRPAPDVGCRPSGSSSSNTISPSVSVPVLSRHTTSTRARPSTAGSSCTSTLRRASVTAATPKATLVSSTRPSGTIPTTPATVPRSAASRLVVARAGSRAAAPTPG